MATTFDYKVRDRAGNMIQGSLDGDSLALVVGRLRSMGYLPVSVTPARSKGLKTDLSIPFFTDRIKAKDVAVFTRQFATMIDSGLSISRALSVLSVQVNNKALGNVIREVRDDVESGLSLSESLRRRSKVFGDLYVSMVRAGEVGGQIDTVLATLATQLEKQVELSRKIRGAMMYPIIVVSIIAIIFVAMMILIVPVFKKLFLTLKAPLPAPTRAIIAVSNTLASWKAGIVVAVIVGAIIAFRRWKRTEDGRMKWDTIKMRPPIFGPLAQKASLARFSSTMSSLLAAGVPMMESLDIVARASHNAVVEKATAHIKTAVRQGKPFSEPMKEALVFPQLLIQMVEVGEQTGALDDMLSKAADYYQGEVDQTVSNLSSILEPILVVFMGAVVGTIIVSLYLPMLTYIKYVH